MNDQEKLAVITKLVTHEAQKLSLFTMLILRCSSRFSRWYMQRKVVRNMKTYKEYYDIIEAHKQSRKK